MAPFDEKKAYAEQESEVFFDDGREIELLHFIYNHPSIAEIRGSPTAVLRTIDEFARKERYLMNVGEYKGKIVTDLIAQVKPQTMVELGGYVGYSAVMFGAAVRKAGGKRYFSLERNPEFGAVVMSLISLAGLDDIVKVVIGPSADSISRLRAEGSLECIDLMFLDHYKPAYVTDLKLCERLHLIRPGSVMAADNVISPGNPPYLEYVRSSVERKKEQAQTGARNGVDSRFAERVAGQYRRREGEEDMKMEVQGNPNLIYESKLIESFEPTGLPDGIEITKCVGEKA
ncbi:MAG: hypothetical protein M1819_005408 [Sarea resinae]|nr:MAG: hypothetical protein M1819_005408 [Sarea resinae]